MRIVFILPDLPLSGAATRTVHLAEHLVGEGNEVVVVTFLRRVDKSIEERLRKSGVGVVSLVSLHGVRRTCRWIIGDSATVIHAAMPTAGLLGLFLARISRRPIVYSYTNCIHTQRPMGSGSMWELVKSWLERFLATRCDALHAVSDSVAVQLRRAYPYAADRVHAIPYRVTPPASGGGDRELRLLGSAVDAWPKLLYVGRLLAHKRVDDVIRAVVSVREKWPNVRLVILGSGPEHGRLVSLAVELAVVENVLFVGESRNPDRFFDWADLLLHPSLYEGYPRVFAEAVAKRTPVVSIDSPYARELAQTGAPVFLARPMDSGSFAVKIIDALQHVRPDWERGGESVDARVCTLCELYLRLVANMT